MKQPFFLLASLLLGTALTAQAQPRLVPCDKLHYDIWNRTLSDYYRDEADYQYIVAPSFSRPCALYIPSCFGSAGKERQLSCRQQGKEWAMACDSLTARRLSALVHYAVQTAMFPYEPSGLDGVTYFFFDRFRGAYCWSPRGSSPCGRLVGVMEQTCKAVQQNDAALLRRQMPAIDSLLCHFKQCMPHEWAAVTAKGGTWNLGDERDGREVTLAAYGGAVKLVFTFPDEQYSDSLPSELLARYRPVAEAFARWVFLQTHALDMGECLIIEVSNRKPFLFCKVHEYGYKSTVSEAELHADTLITRFRGLLE